MANNVEITYTSPSGTHTTIEVEIQDTNGQAGIQQDEITAQVPEILRRRYADDLAAGRIRRLPGHITVDSYRIDSDLNRTGMQLTGVSQQRFSSPLAFDINNAREVLYRASVAGAPGVADVDFHSDGAAGLGPAEAYEAMSNLFAAYGVNFREYTTNPGILQNTERGRQLATLLASPDAKLQMGSDNANAGGTPIMTAITVARNDSRVPAEGRFYRSDAPPSSDPNSPGYRSTDPNQGDAVNQFLWQPTPENLQRIDRERARQDDLIAMFMAALASGNLEVIMPLLETVARKSNMTTSEIAMRTARLLGMSDQQQQDIAHRMEQLNLNPTDPNARSAASRDMQVMQTQLQANTSQRQQIIGMLQQTMSASESNASSTGRLRDGYQAWRRAENR